MKLLELQYNTVNGDCQSVRVQATIQAIIDRVNNHTKILTTLQSESEHYAQSPDRSGGYPGNAGYDPRYEKGVPPKRFKAEDIKLTIYVDAGVLMFKSEAEAQAALDYLLNL